MRGWETLLIYELRDISRVWECRLIEVIKSLASSGATRLTKGEGGLGLGASNSRQGRYDAYIVQIKSKE